MQKFSKNLNWKGKICTFSFGLFEWPLKTFLVKVFQQWLRMRFEGLTKGYQPVQAEKFVDGHEG